MELICEAWCTYPAIVVHLAALLLIGVGGRETQRAVTDAGFLLHRGHMRRTTLYVVHVPCHEAAA